MSRILELFKQRESVASDPYAPLRSALQSSPEVYRLLLETLTDEAARTQAEQRFAAAGNNALALAFASGKSESVMALIAMMGAKE